MIKRIFNFFLKDIICALRDKMPLYMLFAPLVIAGLMKIFLPSIESASVTFAIDKSSVEKEIISKTEDFGNIQLYNNIEEVKNRINGFDDAIGLVKENEKYVIILEGNEPKEIQEISSIIIDSVLSEDTIQFERENLGTTKSFLTEYFISVLMLFALYIGAVLCGFRIVDEKEAGTINAIGASPLRMSEYTVSIGIFILIITLFLALTSSFIMLGTNANYIKILIGLILSLPLGILIAFYMGGLANNQITAIAIMKVSNLFFTGIPVGSIFVPADWQWVFYPFPNYWMLRIFRNIFEISTPQLPVPDFWLSCLLTFGLSIIYLLLLLPFFGKKIKLR